MMSGVGKPYNCPVNECKVYGSKEMIKDHFSVNAKFHKDGSPVKPTNTRFLFLSKIEKSHTMYCIDHNYTKSNLPDGSAQACKRSIEEGSSRAEVSGPTEISPETIPPERVPSEYVPKSDNQSDLGVPGPSQPILAKQTKVSDWFAKKPKSKPNQDIDNVHDRESFESSKAESKKQEIEPLKEHENKSERDCDEENDDVLEIESTVNVQSDTDILDLVQHLDQPFRPGKNFKFPKKLYGKNDIRSAHDYWFDDYPWLHWDCSKNKLFCFPCMKAKNEKSPQANKASQLLLLLDLIIGERV